MTQPAKVMTQAREFFDRVEWRYVADGDQMLRGLATGTGTQWHWAAEVRGLNRFLVFASICPVDVPPARRTAVSEYLSRANWGLPFGGFDLDWSDGQVVFRTAVPITSTGVSRQAMEHLAFANCATMDQYLPGLLSVVLAGANPETAVNAVEIGESDPEHRGGPPDDANMIPPTAHRPGRLFLSDN